MIRYIIFDYNGSNSFKFKYFIGFNRGSCIFEIRENIKIRGLGKIK
jgi:hypothetical protein